VSLHKLGISWDKDNGGTFIMFLDSEFRSGALHCRNEQHTHNLDLNVGINMI
jgi:hypothetical protein